jgi:hypothetical protein
VRKSVATSASASRRATCGNARRRGWASVHCRNSGNSARKRRSANDSGPISRRIGIGCRRSCEQSATASGPAGGGALSANALPGQCASSLEAGADGTGFVAVSGASGSAGRVTDARARGGGEPGARRVAATPGRVATGGVARECETDLLALDGRRADGADQPPHQGRGPSPCATTGGDRSEPAVE